MIIQKFAKHSSLAILALLLFVQIAQGQNTKFINGRVVDEAQRPVAHAIVTLHPLRQTEAEIAESVDGLIAEYRTDWRGRFRILAALSPQQKAMLYVTTPVLPNAYAPLTAPFTDLAGVSLFAGQPITINEGRDTNVGDVPVKVRYSTVVIHLQDSSGSLLFKRTGNYSSIWLRVRDERGDIVSEGSVPSQAIHEDDSSVFVELPEGVWRVELDFNIRDARWHAMNKPLKMRASRGDLQLTLKVDNDASPTQCNNKVSGDNHPEAARKELEKLGVEFNADSFVERAARGNQNAVQLFLSAGMRVNVKDRNGTPVLVGAANYPEIIKCLLAAGASVNSRDVDGDTALIHAAIHGNTESVEALLDQGAELNAKTKDGTTALMFAASNGQVRVVRALLDAGADLNTRNTEGLTALDYAMQSGEEDVVRLLRPSGVRK